MEEKYTITEWCIKLDISLLEPKYYEDDNQYTIHEFENIVPRDIQVPLSTNNNEKERILNATIQAFYKDKQHLDYYKKETDAQNKEIKEILSKLNKTEFETDNGLIAKVTTQKRESFDEDKLIEIAKYLISEKCCRRGVIKTKEYIDMDELESAIYDGEFDASELQPARIIKEVVTLKVTERKNK